MDQGDPDPICPYLELLDRCGPKRVGGCEQHCGAILLQTLGDLGDRRGLACPVDPDDEGDAWGGCGHGPGMGAGGVFQKVEQARADGWSELVGGHELPSPHAVPEVVSEPGCEIDSGVGGDQCLFDAIDVSRLDRTGSSEGLADRLEKLGMGHEETAFQLFEESACHLLSRWEDR